MILYPSDSDKSEDCPKCDGEGTMHLWDEVVGDEEVGQWWLCENCEYLCDYTLPEDWD